MAFELYRAVLNYAEWNGLSYATIAEVLAALKTTEQEFYRRKAAPYEDAKIVENGDVTGRWSS